MFKCAAFVGVLFVLTGAGVLIVKNWPATQPKPTSEETAVTERLDVLNVETNAALPSELADYYISELDDMTGQTNDADQLFDLQMNRVKVYINSGRYEEAIKTEEDLLATGDLTEKQRFHIYISMADTYIYYLQDPEKLKKYVDLLLGSSALSERDDAGSFKRYYTEELKKQGVNGDEN